MSVHDEILGFLDGTLPADAEAELLHRMSVSPERRNLLRSYFQQQSLFAQDRSSLNVPLDAEQGLWAKLDSMMPPVPAALPTAMAPSATGALGAASLGAASKLGFFSKLSASGAALVASLLLVAGFGAGYLANNGQDNTTQPNTASITTTSTTPKIIYRDAAPQVITKERIVTRYITRYITLPSAGPAIAGMDDNASNVVNTDAADQITNSSSVELAPVSTEPGITLAQPVKPIELSINVGGEQNKPVFASLASTKEETPQKSFLQRFEFSFNESFGKQFPNTEATNTTLPLITNSALSVFWQVLPRSEKLWIGASLGTANVTRKNLTTVRTNILDPTEEEVFGEYVHVQSNWAGAFLQYRLPFSERIDLTTTAGYGFATAGQMAIGELGVHYDATKDVGFTVGVRGTRLSYDLKSEMSELMANRKGSLSVPRGVTDATPSFNLELATGLFFHF